MKNRIGITAVTLLSLLMMLRKSIRRPRPLHVSRRDRNRRLIFNPFLYSDLHVSHQICLNFMSDDIITLTNLLDQIQTLSVVHPVDVDPNQTFPAERRTRCQSDVTQPQKKKSTFYCPSGVHVDAGQQRMNTSPVQSSRVVFI